MKFTATCAAVMMAGAAHAAIIPSQSASYADFPPSQISVPNMETLDAKRDRRSAQIFTRVEYAQKSGQSLHLMIVRPEPMVGLDETLDNFNYPVIAFVQGSAWFKQHLGRNLEPLTRMAERGYVVAIVEYRPSTVAPFPAQVEDTKTALRYLKEHAREYGGNPEEIIVWGNSSGGHTASMVGVTLDTQDFDAEDQAPIQVKAVIDYFGPTAIHKMNEEPSTYDHIQPDSPEGMLIGGVNVLENIDKAEAANPMNYISEAEEMPPFLIIHGDKDRLVPFGQSAALFQVLQEKGHEARFIKLKGADHGGAPFWQDEILDLVDDFIRKNLS